MSTGTPAEPAVSVVGGGQAAAPAGVKAIAQAQDPFVRMFSGTETVVPDMPPAS